MLRKIIPIISITIITLFAIFFFVNTSSIEKDVLSETFFVNAIYQENTGIIEITFEDKSQKTSFVTLEILGMSNSYQKLFEGSAFTEKVTFGKPPKHGWQVHPITLIIEHSEFGKIGVKTEIYEKNDPNPSVIFSRL